MYPECVHIGRLTVHWYGVMMALGFVAGLANWTLIGRRGGRDFNFLADLLFWIMLSGILGARVAYVLGDLPYYLQYPGLILRVDRGGLVYYGGFIGAAVALFAFARVQRQRAMDLLDLVVTSVPLAHAFGRFGCFLNGCCFGRLYDGPLAVRFPGSSLAWETHVARGDLVEAGTRALAVFPVQLLEAAFNLGLYVVLVRAYRKRRIVGTVTAGYLLSYPVGRFVLEFLRGHDRVRYAGLSGAQWVSIGLLLLGIGVLARALRKREAVEA